MFSLIFVIRVRAFLFMVFSIGIPIEDRIPLKFLKEKQSFAMELYLSILVVSVMVLIALLSSKISTHINVPCLIIFLVVGMLAGSEGIGGIYFDNAKFANYLGSIALAFILFSGGFDTSWISIKRVFLVGGILSSVGVLLTAFFCGLFAWGFFQLALPNENVSFSWCFLLGSIISSTDAAAVFSILRSRSVSLKGKLRPLLEFESGSNDPMAAFLTVFMVGVVTNEALTATTMPLIDYWIVIPIFAVKMSIGIGVGLSIGFLGAYICNKIDFEYQGLYYVLSVVIVLFAFALPEMIYGNGFMSVYVAGIVMGNRRFIFKNGIGRFYDGMAWIMQVVLFMMLGLLCFPMQIWHVKWVGLIVAAFLMFVARPLAVFIGMIGSKFTMKERTFVSWVGLRGGAPIMLATFPLMADVTNANLMFSIVFFIVITSVLLQGATIMPLAKIFNLDAPLHKAPPMPLSIENTGNIETDSIQIEVPEALVGKMISELEFPDGLLILLIHRGDKFIVPRGTTRFCENDVLTIMGNKNLLERVF